MRAPRAASARHGPSAAELARAAKEKQRQARFHELNSITFGLNEDGSVWIRDANSNFVTAKSELDLIWREYAADLTLFLQNQLQTFGRAASLLAKIHCDTPDPSQPRPFQPAAFIESAPTEPGPVGLPAQPQRKPVAQSIIGSMTGENRRLRQAGSAEHTAAIADWQTDCAIAKREHEATIRLWRQEEEAWSARKSRHEAQQRDFAAHHTDLIRTDADYAREVVQRALESMTWPREMTVALAPPDDLATGLKLDIDLPEIEDFPRQTADIHSSGRRLALKDKSEKQLRTEYAAHIHGVMLRIVGTVFWCLPDLRGLTASGYSQRINKATGHIEDEYLLSFKVDRATFSRLNFSQLEFIDPIQALTAFDLKRSMSAAHDFTKITPH